MTTVMSVLSAIISELFAISVKKCAYAYVAFRLKLKSIRREMYSTSFQRDFQISNVPFYLPFQLSGIIRKPTTVYIHGEEVIFAGSPTIMSNIIRCYDISNTISDFASTVNRQLTNLNAD